LPQLLTNAHVFAPADAGIRHLLIGGGRILAMANDRKEIEATSATVVDLAGRRLIPGLIDGHAHVTGGGGESGFASRVPPQSIGRFTRAGVTTVVGVLGTDDTTRDTRSLLAQTHGLREEGLGAWCHTGGYHFPPVTLTGSVRDDIVFLDPVIGVGELALSDHRSSQPTCDELLRIASDAHVAGMISGKAGIVHLHLGDGSRGLDLVRMALEESEIPGRVFNPTHVNRRKALFDEALALTRHGCSIDITAFPVDDGEDAWPADVALTRYIDSGAPASLVTISSDGGGCLPHFNEQGELLKMGFASCAAMADTLKSLLDRGLPEQTVLPLLSSNVANLLKLKHKGHIQSGYDADLVVLDQSNRIVSVMARGVWQMKNNKQLVSGLFEP
jgi:beta-aspartyl-dipeptidase (metallo-type)